jgi:hypothetical protein
MNRTKLLVLSFGLSLLSGCLVNLKTHGFGGSSSESPPPTASEAPARTTSNHTSSTAPSGTAATGRMAGVGYHDIDKHVVAKVDGFVSACFADYDDMRARSAAFEAKYRAQFDALKKLPTYYAQRDALKALSDAYIADVRAAKLDVKGATWEFLTKSGLPREVDEYAAALHRERGISRPIAIFSSYFPAFANDTLAGDVYCETAAQLGTHRTRTPGFGLHMSEVLPPDRSRAVAAYLKQQRAQNDEALAVAKPPERTYTPVSVEDTITTNSAFETGSLLEVGALVESVKRGNHSVVIRAAQTGNGSSQHDCQDTDKVDSIGADGHLNYRQVCQFSFSKTKMTFDLVFRDAPDGIKVGDWVDFDAVIKRASHDKADAKTGLPHNFAFELDGRLVRQVARAKKKGDAPWQFAALATY